MVAGGMAFDGADHEVFVGVFGGDEFDDIGFVAHDAQREGAKGVCEDVGEAFLEDAVVEYWLKGLHGAQLFVQVAMAAGSAQDQAGLGGDALDQGFVGCGIAGVEGQHDVWGGLWDIVENGRLLKTCAGEA